MYILQIRAHDLLESVGISRREIWVVLCLMGHMGCFVAVLGEHPLVEIVMWYLGVRVM